MIFDNLPRRGKASPSRKAAEERSPQRKLWEGSKKPTEAPAGRKNRHGNLGMTMPVPKTERLGRHNSHVL